MAHKIKPHIERRDQDKSIRELKQGHENGLPADRRDVRQPEIHGPLNELDATIIK